MTIFLRATTPDLISPEHFKLARKSNQTRTILKFARGAFCLVSLFLFCAPAPVSAQHYRQTNLVSDVPGLAQFTDPDLVNPWGLIASGTSPWWVANEGTGLSTLYNGAGVKQALVVTVAPTPSGPTGIVFNGSTDFQLVAGTPSTAARFIFVTVQGTISGWNPTVNPTNSVVK